MGLFKNKEEKLSVFYFNPHTGRIDMESGEGFIKFFSIDDQGNITINDEEIFNHINKCIGHDVFYTVRNTDYYNDWFNVIYSIIVSNSEITVPKENSLVNIWNNIETDKNLHNIFTIISKSLDEEHICDFGLVCYDNKMTIIPVHTINRKYLTNYLDTILLCRLICTLEDIPYSKVIGICNLTNSLNLKIPSLYVVENNNISNEDLDTIYETVSETVTILNKNIIDARSIEKITKTALIKDIPGSNNESNFIKGDIIIKQKLTNNFNITSNMNSKINKLILKEDIPTISRNLEHILISALPRASELTICNVSYYDDEGEFKQLTLDIVDSNDI